MNEYVSYQQSRSQGGVGTVIPMLQARQHRNCSLIPSKENNFSLFHSVQTSSVLGPTHPHMQWVPGALSPGVKEPQHEAYCSSPSSTNIKNECSICGRTIKFANSLLNTTVVTLKVLPLGSYALMPAPSPPFITILQLVLWNGLQSCHCITPDVINVIKMPSFQNFPYLWEQKNYWGLDLVNRLGVCYLFSS